jgi:hypothetical protein
MSTASTYDRIGIGCRDEVASWFSFPWSTIIAGVGADAKNCGGGVVSIELPKNADDHFHYGLGRGIRDAASSPLIPYGTLPRVT